MTSQTGQQIFTIRILSSISRGKSNQIIKFGHLIEYIIRNIFLEKSASKCGGEASAITFHK